MFMGKLKEFLTSEHFFVYLLLFGWLTFVILNWDKAKW